MKIWILEGQLKKPLGDWVPVCKLVFLTEQQAEVAKIRHIRQNEAWYNYRVSVYIREDKLIGE